jgi:tetratricopeptide (TPR) repeat protein
MRALPLLVSAAALALVPFAIAQESTISTRVYETDCPPQLDVATAAQLNECAANLLDANIPDIARERLDLALERAGNDPACRAAIEANLGAAWWLEGKYAAASPHYEEALRQLTQIRQASTGARYGCDVRALREETLRARLGAALLRGSDDGVRRAREQYEAIAAANPAAARSGAPLNLLNNIVHAAFAKEDLPAARAAAERLLQQAGSNSPEAPGTNRVLGEIALRDRRLEDALRYFERTLAAPNVSNLTQTLATRGLADTYLALDRKQDALRVINSAVAGALNRDQLAAALQTRAWILIRIGDRPSFEAALNDYQRIRETDPTPLRIAHALAQEGYIYHQLERWNEAVRAYAQLEQALLDDDTLSTHAGVLSLHDVRVALGNAQERAGQRQLAGETLNEALLTPGATTPAQIQYRIGVNEFKAENWARARDALRESLRNEPASPQARTIRAMLAHALLKLGEETAAAAEAEAALALGYDDPRSVERRAMLSIAATAYYRQHDYARAIRHFDELTPVTDREEDRLAHAGTYLLLEPPDFDNALRVYAMVANAGKRNDGIRNVYVNRARRAYCAARFTDAAADYRRMSELARQGGDSADAARSLVLTGQAELAQLLYDYAQAGRTPRPTAEQRARIDAIDTVFADALAGLPATEQPRAIVRRGDLAFLAYDWRLAREYYTDPRLTATERAAVAPRLRDIRRLLTPGVIAGDLPPVTEYYDPTGCH